MKPPTWITAAHMHWRPRLTWKKNERHSFHYSQHPRSMNVHQLAFQTQEERSMSVETAQDLFIDELKDIYSAEKQAVRTYPRLAKVVQSEELKEALQEHLEQTKQQIERLDKVFEILEVRSGGKTCEGMKGLLEEAATHAEEIDQGPVLDAALI